MTTEPHSVDLSGKVAFVAGASGGINLAIAEAFGAAGAKVGLISRDEERIAAAAAQLSARGIDALGFAADVRDYDAVNSAIQKTAAQHGPIDIVLSGAAGNFAAPALGMSANGFKAVVDIDLLGTFNVLRAAFEHLHRTGASLVSISAPQATHPAAFQSHVCAAKAGINMLTKCLALEWGPLGVRVNAVSPGAIDDTEGMRRLAPTEDARHAVVESTPLGRLGAKSDIVDAVLFLCSPAARFITGTIIDCDGGLSLTGMGNQIGQATAGLAPSS